MPSPGGSPDTEETVEALATGLAELGQVSVRAMFGGRGVFVDETMTAIVDRSGWGYVRGDDASAVAMEAAGAVRHGRMPYWRVPGDVWSNPDELAAWLVAAHRTAQAHA